MNKKIRELSEQADFQALDIFEAHPDFPKNVPFDYFNDNRNRIFAELIIKETLEVVRDEVQYALDDYLADTINLRVKNHFGVE